MCCCSTCTVMYCKCTIDAYILLQHFYCTLQHMYCIVLQMYCCSTCSFMYHYVPLLHIYGCSTCTEIFMLKMWCCSTCAIMCCCRTCSDIWRFGRKRCQPMMLDLGVDIKEKIMLFYLSFFNSFVLWMG